MMTNQRDHVSDMYKTDKNEYYLAKIEPCGSDQKKLYQFMNELLHREGPALLAAHDSNKVLADKFWTTCTILDYYYADHQKITGASPAVIHTSYRPVSSLQYTSKVLVKVVASKLTSYMRNQDLY